jgi:hydroxylamine oxidation protein HaoB
LTSATTSRAVTPARRNNRLLPSLGILLVTGGVLLLAWFAWLWFNPGPAPYRYQLVEEGGVDKFSKLGLEAWPDLTIAQYDVHAEQIDKPLASGHTARRGQTPPVLIAWENHTSELIASVDGKLSEGCTDPRLVGHLAPDQTPGRARHPLYLPCGTTPDRSHPLAQP